MRAGTIFTTIVLLVLVYKNSLKIKIPITQAITIAMIRKLIKRPKNILRLCKRAE